MDITFEKFTWKIKNFSKLNTNKVYSETFFIGGYPWRILIFPKGNKAKSNADYLSIYLDAGNLVDFPEEGSRVANLKLTLINQVNSQRTVTKETDHKFNATVSDWGFTSFISLAEFRDCNNGFLINDACMVEAEIAVRNPIEHVKPPIKHEPKEFCVASCGDQLVDFKGFGKIEEVFVPLPEEVCSLHPSLIDCQRKRSRRFTEWTFTALGRVLHFLKSIKVKDMNEDACSHLQNLWEELETCKFDLTWLQPHIQSALSIKCQEICHKKLRR